MFSRLMFLTVPVLRIHMSERSASRKLTHFRKTLPAAILTALVIYFDIYQQEEPMARTAKLFRNGRSQAVRLPSDFRFEGNEVYIRQDSKTGDIILSRRPDSWESFFKLTEQLGVPEDFMDDRQDQPPQKRKLFR